MIQAMKKQTPESPEIQAMKMHKPQQGIQAMKVDKPLRSMKAMKSMKAQQGMSEREKDQDQQAGVVKTMFKPVQRMLEAEAEDQGPAELRDIKKRLKELGVSIKHAKGQLARLLVFHRIKKQTRGGLRREHLRQTNKGRIISIKASNHAKLNYDYIKGWHQAYLEARKALGIKSWSAPRRDSLLFKKAKEIELKRLEVQTNHSD